MGVVNVIVRAALFATAVAAAAPADNIPNENEWLIKAQASIKDSMSNLESYGVETDKIKEITNGAFDAFTKFVRTGLSRIIEQTDDTKLEEISILRDQLENWSTVLERLNRVGDEDDKSAENALGKFRVTIDYLSSEAAEFDKNYDFESAKSKRIVNELEELGKESVMKLAEYARSVEDQVSGFSKY